DGSIVIASPAGMAAFKPRKQDGRWSVETLWSIAEGTMYLSNPGVIAHTIYGLSTKAGGQYFAGDAKSGKVLWLGAPRTATNTAVVKSGRLLFLLNDNSELIVARPSRTGFEPLKRYNVADSAPWAQPVISGNRIFVKDVST